MVIRVDAISDFSERDDALPGGLPGPRFGAVSRTASCVGPGLNSTTLHPMFLHPIVMGDTTPCLPKSPPTHHAHHR